MRDVVRVTVAWAMAGVVSLVVANKTAAGPVVLTLSTNHGIHLGDLVAAGLGALAAASYTLFVFRPHSGR